MSALLLSVLPSLMKDEGFRSKPYRDSVGVLTIGYGTNLEEGLDEEEALFLLEYRTNKAILDCRTAFPWFAALDPMRQGVVVQMRYQLGLEGLREFRKMLAAIAVGDFNTAADEMLDSKWAQRDSPTRAHRLARVMRTGKRA